MKAVILAAGEGARMRPLTYTRPKIMLPIANKPIVEHLLIEAKQAGIKEFIFIVGYRDEAVRKYFGNGDKWGVSIGYHNQRKQLGTADAVRMVEHLIDGNFVMMNGDIIIRQADIRKLARRKETTMSVIEVEDTRDLGSVEIKGRHVVRIYEKVKPAAGTPSNVANTGLYLFTPDIFTAISHTAKSPRGEYEITDSLQWLIDQGWPVGYQKMDYWLDLSYPWNLLDINESLLPEVDAHNSGQIEEGAVIKGKVSIGKGTVVKSGAYIVGPVIIGQDCDIGPNCYIRPHTAIGDRCHIGNAVEVKNSIIMNGSKIPHLNYVGDSVIGEGCNLGAGTKVANLRFDKQEITVGGRSTKRHKLGAIIGDNVETGINVSINAGSVIGNNTWIGPAATVSGVISPDSRIF
ncbi:MAG: sugar phosphate nucleotidyltransferase [Dehalococcoidales bacterium]|nr:sugar phosphate nucleotidyltransferase [Dehalococcoidales bacterium]